MILQLTISGIIIFGGGILCYTNKTLAREIEIYEKRRQMDKLIKKLKDSESELFTDMICEDKVVL